MKTLWVSPLWKNFFKCILSKNVEIGLEASILPEKSNEFLHTNFNISHQTVSREFCPSFDGNTCWTKKGQKLGDSFFRSKTEIVTTDFVHDATTTHVGRTSDECWLLQQSTGRCFHHIRREMSATRTCRTVPSSKSAYTHVNVRNIQMGVHKNRDLKGGNAKRDRYFFNSTLPWCKGCGFDDLLRHILINCLYQESSCESSWERLLRCGLKVDWVVGKAT